MTEQQTVSAGKHEVRIHIDRTPYRSPSPTDGDALYALGKVKPGHQLYQEVLGDQEDTPVPAGTAAVRLTEDEHFYSAPAHKKGFTIIVNGRPKEVDKKILSFEEIVALAALPGDANTIYTVTYKKGRRHAEGTLVAGETIHIKDGMIFNVALLKPSTDGPRGA